MSNGTWYTQKTLMSALATPAIFFTNPSTIIHFKLTLLNTHELIAIGINSYTNPVPGKGLVRVIKTGD